MGPARQGGNFSLLFIFVIILFFTAKTVFAQGASFRDQFIAYYHGFMFEAQVKLIKKNKDIIPTEINLLVAQAMGAATFEERMYLLDIANAMATMYKFWVDKERDEQLKMIELLQRTEMDKEKKRLAKLMKWKKEEKFLGNFVMKKHMSEMEAEKLPPVIYPHWVHRIWFECKVCHQDIFAMKRWVNKISQKDIVEGKQCGVCHNGKLAFSAEKDCKRCHIAGTPESERMHNLEKLDYNRIEEVALRIGSEWNTKKLPGGKMPVDKYGFIDWIELKKKGVFKPIVSLDKSYKDKIRKNRILFKAKSDFVNSVLFDHEVHSTWIKCSTCHPSIFKESLSNDISMKDMSKGRHCGHCHSKVSFTFSDCQRCHTQKRGDVPDGVLLHKLQIAEAANKK